MSKVSDDHFSFSGQFAVISDIETFFKSKGIPAEVQEIIRAAEPPKTKKEKTKRVTTDNLSIKGSLVKVAKTFIEYLWSKPSGTLTFKSDEITETITKSDSPEKIETILRKSKKVFFQIGFKL